MSIKVAQKRFHKKMIDFETFSKLPKTVGYLGKLVMPKALKSCPKSTKSPNLVTLVSITMKLAFCGKTRDQTWGLLYRSINTATF